MSRSAHFGRVEWASWSPTSQLAPPFKTWLSFIRMFRVRCHAALELSIGQDAVVVSQGSAVLSDRDLTCTSLSQRGNLLEGST